MNFFHYIYDDEIGERAFAYLFSMCSSAEMLYAAQNYDCNGLEKTAKGTDWAGLIPAIKGVVYGKSWGMEGRIYSFALTDAVKKIIAENGLGMVKLFDGKYYLENLTLLAGDKIMYSTCSHEGYGDIDEDFKNKVSDFCRGEIVKTALYKETLERYKKLPARSKRERAEIRSKLYDLNAQVENAWEKYIRGVPRWEGLTYEEYLTLAKPVFSVDVYERLENARSFRGLQPLGYARVAEEIDKFRGVPEFSNSRLMGEIEKQLDMMQTVFFIEEGLDDWRVDGDETLTPSIIINEEKEDDIIDDKGDSE